MNTKMSKVLGGVLALMIFSAVTFSFMRSNADGEPWKIPAKYEKMENPTIADDESISIGKSLYKKHCASCHGKSGIGDGKKAGELETEMPDLTSDEFKAFKPGAKYFQSFIGRDEMPNFEKKITDDEERWFVINYINAL